VRESNTTATRTPSAEWGYSSFCLWDSTSVFACCCCAKAGSGSGYARPRYRAACAWQSSGQRRLISGFILFVLFTFARLVFGVHIQGSFLGFLGVCAAFSLMTAAFGLMIAALGKTVEATRGYAVMATLIMVMLGGAWVPTFVFPQWLQKVTVVIPTRWAMDGLDGMTWRGLGLSAAFARSR